MKSSELHTRLVAAGMKPAPLHAKLEEISSKIFMVFAIIMAIEAILFFDAELAGSPHKSVALMFYTASMLFATHGVNFMLFLYGEFNPQREIVRISDTVSGTVAYFIAQPSTIYTVFMFGYAYALYVGSWLYWPLLVAAIVITAFIVVDGIPSWKAALCGGGQGLSDSDME